MGDAFDIDSGNVANDDTCGLRILIVGGGIGGLCAAIALRRQGHDVHVFEQAKEIRGIGYGIHLAPNGVGLLRFLGYNPEVGDAVPMNNIRFFKHTGEQVAHEDRKATAGRWQNEWFLASRVKLLGGLLELATTTEGEGKPVKISTSSKVRSVDTEKASFELEDGSIHSGDLIIGADGVYSKTRDAITKTSPYRSSHNCFRIFYSRDDLEQDPSVHFPTDETMDLIYSPQTKTVMYTTLGNTKYNCVVTHKTELTAGVIEDPKKKLLEICASHDAKFVNLFKKADPEKLKVWPLYDMDTLPTFVKGRLAIMGDAAHPFTPHLAQGAVMAIEDAISLSVMLCRGISAAQTPERLQLFDKARRDRSTFIQKLSLVVGGDRVQDGGNKGGQGLSVQKHLDMALSHDEHHASTQILREWEWQQTENAIWLQPTVFGPYLRTEDALHSRSHAFGNPFTLTASIKFKTSATLLRNFFPTQNYSFEKTDSVAVASFQVSNFRNVGWLAGGNHDSLAFYVHGVQHSTSDDEKSVINGKHCPIMLDNSPDVMVVHREKYGLPKVYSEIDCAFEEGKHRTRLSWKGVEWASLELQTQPTEPAVENRQSFDAVENTGLLVHKYIPASGLATKNSKGKAHLDAQYDLHYLETDEHSCESTRTFRAETADIEIKKLDFARLPTLHHIVARLAELPIFDVIEAKVERWNGIKDWSTGHRL